MISADVREAYSKSMFDLPTLNKIDMMYSRGKNRFNGTDVLAYSMNNLDKASRVVQKLNSVRVWPRRRGLVSCERRT